MSRRRKAPPARRITQRKQLTEATAFDAALNGVSIDSDDYLYRPITGEKGSNLPAFQQERMFAIAKHLFRANPVGSRYISLFTDFVLGEGAVPSFKNSEVEAVVMRHWRDPYNDWDRRQSLYFQHLMVFGELLVPLFPNTANGHLRCGLQLVENIKTVNTDPDNWSIVESVRMKSVTGGDEGVLYQTVNTRESRDELTKATNPALFWTRGNPFGERGLSVLYSIADLLDVMDQFVFSEIERTFLLKAFVWDVSINNGQPDEIAKKARDPNYGPPKPGSVRIHNQQEVWTAVNPRLDTYDAWNGIEALRTHTGGAMGLPEHWFGSGGDVNRATASEMDEPTLKRLTMLQREWRYIMVDILQAQIDYAVLAGALPEEVAVEKDGKPTDEMIPSRDAVDLVLPELSGDDNSQTITSLDTLTRALALAETEGFVTHETASRLWLTTATTLGVDIDIPAEIEAAQKELEQREQEEQQQFEQQQDAAMQRSGLRALPARGERDDARQVGGD
jgi:hypothetical protein